jgi:ComF family protein
MHYEKAICLHCQSKLPRLYLCDQQDNPVEKVFWGRVPVKSATALLKMPRNGAAQRLIHRLKYHDDQEVGERLGSMLGSEMLASQRMNDFDFIVPVPLHPKKQHIRGYNQCDSIARGIAETMHCETMIGNLVRTQHTTSQTRKGRLSRWNNVSNIFWVKYPEQLEHKRVLLVDDVITTGATIEACVAVLQKIEGIHVSVASLAIPG